MDHEDVCPVQVVTHCPADWPRITATGRLSPSPVRTATPDLKMNPLGASVTTRSRRGGGEPPRIRLVAQKHEAEGLLSAQVQKGADLLARLGGIQTREQFADLSEAYYNWDAFNLSLLESLFTGPIDAEYRTAGGFVVLGGPANLQLDLSDRRDDIRRDCRRLESIRERLELWEERRAVVVTQLMSASGEAPKRPRETRRAAGDRIFLVHGRDEAAKHEVARYLEKLGHDPLILNEQPNGGRTLVEKLEYYSSQVAFAVIILSPDDEGRLHGDAGLEARARQNVIFEIGYFIGLMGRPRVCALLTGAMTRPSDIDGVAYVSMNENWKIDLADEMRAAGIVIDMNKALESG